MCGIAGIIGSNNVVIKPLLACMANSLSHRGPDDEGIETLIIDREQNIVLGLVHRRLSIIDLTQDGHQPMCNEDGSVWITFNGEIYNYKELYSELKGKGHHFKSRSDTETIIHAFEEWGYECLHKLRGMFALTVWDQKKSILFMAVDRFGIKPLYYTHKKNSLFIFASEIRTILNTGLVERSVDFSAIDSFLAYGAVQAPLTIVSQINSLLPAHYVVYDLKTDTKHTANYWTPSKSFNNDSSHDETEAIIKVRDAFEDSIKIHLTSDVPIGLFLSGGIDSSAVVAVANKLNEGHLQSFSITFAETGFSEAKYSQLIASKYCKDHREIRITADDIMNLLPYALDTMDQPTIDGINVYSISKFVRESGIKVVLSGLGGDEVFGGYSTFQNIPLIQKMFYPFKYVPASLCQFTGKIVDYMLGRSIIRSKVSHILESEKDILSFYLILRQLFNSDVRKQLFHKEYGHETFNGLPLQTVDWLKHEMKELDLFNVISLMELRLYMANMLLRDTDTLSMAHGLEVRVPYLDHHLVELVFNTSASIKNRTDLPKSLLVRAMADLLPQEMYMRPKMGFTFPWELWLKRKLGAQIETLFNDFPENNEMNLDIKRCRILWRMFLEDKPGITWVRMWAIYVLLNWYINNIDL
jgi:asparagine synthase (glutamine-hydrolysing)